MLPIEAERINLLSDFYMRNIQKESLVDFFDKYGCEVFSRNLSLML